MEKEPGQAVAFFWLTVGVACPLLFFVVAPPGTLALSPALFIYLVSVLALELFVGSSTARVPLQRITPAVILALLLMPGLPPAVAVAVDLVGTLLVATISRITYQAMAQSGKALLPASLTAFYLFSRGEPTSGEYFFACEIFVVLSLVTRTKRAPFRSDLFLIVCYPAVALMLRSLTEMNLVFVLLAVPLLFLLTTVDSEMLLRYFDLQKKLDDTQVAFRETRAAQRRTELESRRKGVLLLRKEQQLELLNRLGRELEAAEAAEDLARFLLEESVRLTGADSSLVVLGDGRADRALRILSPAPPEAWGLREGERIPETVKPGVGAQAPWSGPLWEGCTSFISCRLGGEGWLFLARREENAFPEFLSDFFSAVGRHAGSAVLALRRLTQVQASYAQLKRTQQEVVISSQWAAAGRLAANAAHELNTPLGAIRIAAEHIAGELEPGPALESMESLMRSLERCKRVTDRLLITSRPADQGAEAARPETASLGSVLDEAVASMQPYLRASRISLTREGSDLPVRVVVSDLYWAVVNLLKNSVDALSEENAGDKRIHLAVEAVGDTAVITVADNGPGVPDEVRPRLFEPFFTTKKLGQGNGLGLPLSRGNLNRWGGELTFEETPGRGATFVVKVPLAQS